MTYILLLIIISIILSYLILKCIYTIIFKSKKNVSKFLVFLGSIGLIIFYYTPYSYYLEPSFYEFREICQLDPEIYQANGGKIDEEYYNKVLRHFDMSWDAMDWKDIQQKSRINDYGDFLYKIKKYDNRVYYSFTLFFKNNQARRDNIEKIMLYANWDKMRPLPAGNEGTGFFLGSVPISCIYFKKD
ncbi:hypothetical protein [Campylobacter cuniculorum]|uniref:Uncharacterized protein n=2 Tax=Campylobacter cuniculorum TaxID=374106 RepID=A0A1W6BUL7_9BACT|nr:hypothetical protein [Campylobacter cuniculorum]ARJ55782.1 hypothetical protein CCUN_0119 [Campylobacter cuniculorum DSM 23162 = LMG 24588]QOR05001.1 hypothetical protein A0071_03445 [Campylobacter cuniculorum]